MIIIVNKNRAQGDYQTITKAEDCTVPEASLPPQSKSMPSERALAVPYILAEGLSPSGLSFCHLYGF
jgi:hypothetical protein